MNTKNLSIDTTIDFNGFSDYWHGHGHAFDKTKLIMCLQWSMPINYKENIEDIVEGIIDSINGYDWSNYVIDSTLYQKHKKEIDELTDEDLKKSIKENFVSGFKDLDKFWDKDVESFLPECEFDEYPSLIGWIHITENLVKK